MSSVMVMDKSNSKNMLRYQTDLHYSTGVQLDIYMSYHLDRYCHDRYVGGSIIALNIAPSLIS